MIIKKNIIKNKSKERPNKKLLFYSDVFYS